MLRALATVGLVAAAAAIFGVVVRPAQVESASHAAVLDRPPLNGPGPVPRTGLAGEEEGRVEAALAALRPSSAPVPLPTGIEERKPGVFGGRLPWSEVQGFLAWAASQKGAVDSLEVQAVPEEREKAECRLVLVPGEPR